MTARKGVEIVVFPAGAGVILSSAELDDRFNRFPRRCGGDPFGSFSVTRSSAFSPQVRG